MSTMRSATFALFGCGLVAACVSTGPELTDGTGAPLVSMDASADLDAGGSQDAAQESGSGSSSGGPTDDAASGPLCACDDGTLSDSEGNCDDGTNCSISLCTCDDGTPSDGDGHCADGTNCSTGGGLGSLCTCDDGTTSDASGNCDDGTNCGTFGIDLCVCDDGTESDGTGHCDDGTDCGGVTGSLCTCDDGTASDGQGNCRDGTDCWDDGYDGGGSSSSGGSSSGGSSSSSGGSSGGGKGGGIYCGTGASKGGSEDVGPGCVPLNCLEGCKSTWATELCLDIQNGIEPTLDYVLEEELPPGIDLLVMTAEIMNAVATNFPAIACGKMATAAAIACDSPKSDACLDQTAVGICFCQWGTSNPNGQPPQPQASNLCGGGTVNALCGCLANSLSTSSTYDPDAAMDTCRKKPNALHSCPNGYQPSVPACSGHKPRPISQIVTDCNKISNQWYSTWGSNYGLCSSVCTYNTSLGLKNCR